MFARGPDRPADLLQYLTTRGVQVVSLHRKKAWRAGRSVVVTMATARQSCGQMSRQDVSAARISPFSEQFARTLLESGHELPAGILVEIGLHAFAASVADQDQGGRCR